MREIILDTETTGFKPEDGHKIVEIGAVELVNMVPTGQEYHVYVNPKRDVPKPAFDVHGLSQSFLSNHPVFQSHAQDFIDFIADSPLVIHNASFDMRFLNFELKCMGKPALSNPVVDTLTMARKLFPGSPASLDALVRRFQITHGDRTKHGALLDSQILAEVYLHLKGGRQPTFLGSAGSSTSSSSGTAHKKNKQNRPQREARKFEIPPEESDAHGKMVKDLEKASEDTPVWTKVAAQK